MPRRAASFAVLAALVATLTGCATPSASAPPTAGSAPTARTPAPRGRTTGDARVRSFEGQAPPDVFTDGTWVSGAGATSLAALRGKVVYVQFAFPT